MCDVAADVVVVADQGDAHCDAVCDQIVSQGAAALRFNLGDLRSALITAELASLQLQINHRTYTISQSTSVWWRRLGSIASDDLDEEEGRFAADEAPHLLIGALTAVGARFVDDPFAIARAEIKLFQLSVAHDLGVMTPVTRITSDPTSARSFSLGRRVVAKAVSPGIGIAPFVAEVHESDFDLVRALPTMLQGRIMASADLRVVVVEDEAWTWRRPREPDVLDWRQSDPSGTAFEVHIDHKVGDAARRITAGLGLSMSVQDWLETDTGPVFLESNAQGAWLFLQDSAALVLPAVVRHLMEG